MRGSILSLVVAFVLAGMNASAGAFIKFEGVEGEAQDKDHQGWSDLSSMQWGVAKAISPSSGLPTGKRQHKPLTFTKQVDKATPLLMQYCTTGSNVPDVEIHLTRPDRDGTDRTYLIIKMKDVLVTSYSIASGNNDSGEPIPPLEQMELTYGKITWTWTDGSIEHTDDWSTTR